MKTRKLRRPTITDPKEFKDDKWILNFKRRRRWLRRIHRCQRLSFTDYDWYLNPTIKKVPVYNQGDLSSCSGFVGAIALKSNYRHLDFNFSPNFIYEMGQVHDGKEVEEGTTIRGICRGIKYEGAPSTLTIPVRNDADAEYMKIPKEAFTEAYNYRVNSYYRIKEYDREALQWLLRWDITLCRVSMNDELASGKPYLLDEDKFFDRVTGAHAMARIGWEVINGKFGWWFRNSWGSEYGSEGNVWISEDIYKRDFKYEYLLVRDNTEAGQVIRTFSRSTIPFFVKYIEKYSDFKWKF